MIASWMLFAALVGALLTVAAIAFDRVAIARRRPVRMVWFVAIVLSIVWPVGRAVVRLAPERTAPVRIIPFIVTVQSPAMTVRSSIWNPVLVDRALVVLWCGLSAILLFRLMRAMSTLRRTRAAWKSAELDGTPVRLSENVGPAVIGLRRMDVVLPEWILSLDAPLRAIVLRHEEEHRSARDPYLLFGAALAVALMPWNVALWFQARRLRLAIELDCDARVLRAHPSTERYGMLMLTIAQRRSLGPTLFSPMLTEPTTLIERRILAMRPTTRRLARVTVYGGSLLAVAALAFACSLQSDTTAPKSAPQPQRVTDKQTYFEFQVENPAQPLPNNVPPRYPHELQLSNIEGSVSAQIVIDTTGLPMMETFHVASSTDTRFNAPVHDALAQWRFTPADVGGKKVKQLLQLPFNFTLTHDYPVGLVVSAPAASPSPQVRPDHPPAVRTLAPVEIRGAYRPPELPSGVYLEYQVEKPATPHPNNQAPRYPPALRSANVEGEVLAQFIVSESGSVVDGSFQVIRSTDPQFTETVRAALSTFRFYPALVGGQPVKQLIQMPFQFNLAK
jgi:TonB family protein